MGSIWRAKRGKGYRQGGEFSGKDDSSSCLKVAGLRAIGSELVDPISGKG